MKKNDDKDNKLKVVLMWIIALLVTIVVVIAAIYTLNTPKSKDDPFWGKIGQRHDYDENSSAYDSY